MLEVDELGTGCFNGRVLRVNFYRPKIIRNFFGPALVRESKLTYSYGYFKLSRVSKVSYSYSTL